MASDPYRSPASRGRKGGGPESDQMGFTMKRRRWLTLGSVVVFAAALMTSAVPAQEATREDHPNIVLILADDLGYGDLGVFGSPTIDTPRLDRLAAEGVKLTSFYVASPACTPSRASLLTGRYPIRSGMNAVLGPDAEKGLPSSEVTLAELLGETGYHTSLVGKWHLGDRPAFLPTEHGFDDYFGLLYSNDMMPPWVQTKKPLRLYRGAVEQPGEVDSGTLTTRYTEEAIRVIREQRRQPFFLYLAYSMPHVPIGSSAAFEGKSAGGRYGDVIEELDWNVGRILDTLRELRLDDRTLVIFTSDNGPWTNMPSRMLVDDRIRLTDAGTAGPFRGSKGTTWEGGVRVPFIARWRGRIDPGLVSADIASALDLLPTLARLAGAALPAHVPLDGLDIMPLLEGSGPSPRQDLFYFNDGRLEALREGQWKLKVEWKKGFSTPVPELYDLTNDPFERHNVAGGNPETAERMLNRLVAFAKETGAVR
ncbi:MAG: sulfatase [Acidobacteriota bacterium]